MDQVQRDNSIEYNKPSLEPFRLLETVDGFTAHVCPLCTLLCTGDVSLNKIFECVERFGLDAVQDVDKKVSQ